MRILLGIRSCLTAAMLVLVLAITSASCAKGISITTPYTNQDTALTEVATLDLWNSYQADPVVTAEKFSGKHLYFTKVRVDKIVSNGEPLGSEHYIQESINPEGYGIIFTTYYLADIIGLDVGHIVQIVGRYEGIKDGCIVVWIEWINPIDPPRAVICSGY